MSVALAWRVARDPGALGEALDEVGQVATATGEAKISLRYARVQVAVTAKDVAAEFEAARRCLEAAAQRLGSATNAVRVAEDEVRSVRDRAGALCSEWAAGLSGVAATAVEALEAVETLRATATALEEMAGQALRRAEDADRSLLAALRVAGDKVDVVAEDLDAVRTRLREAL
ncbi:hypothetical protein [Streptoalloteichus tenebrarius]|uniref:hypothetical protein n=1 Tax=Streptoalloteichus tenebrarius (strain ATCC 17920 / DSM 40477 / JCM 4838 / CBS 697.72 / NBRC 16177 / NCIMB 11028 / NRRL B-12390 / A12253. 1 / ISP 5477) TaxID=1933 RepID=UPI002646D708|nr:hypothetical protein [Streptoalloteichus tenebrarius]